MDTFDVTPLNVGRGRGLLASVDSFDVTPFTVGRGRGLLSSSTPMAFSMGDHRKATFRDDSVHSPVRAKIVMEPLSESVAESPQNTNTQNTSISSPGPYIPGAPVPPPPLDDVRLANQMSTIVQQIGQQLADSVMSHLDANSTAAMRASHKGASEEKDSFPGHTLDLSQVQLVSQRKVKDPPVFRGESSDILAVDEWEESMTNFIKKSGIKQEEQAEEILVHLRGRAKDVVKFGIRNGEVDVQRNPQAIYGLLRKHFSTSHRSSVPLADFYSTLPREQEDPYEYWLRLNRAADVAASCLVEQGKIFDNPSVEVARMFIRHCPCRDLALSFRSKTIDRWSAREVQEVLDEYHLEKGVRFSAGKNTKISINRVEVSPGVSVAAEAPEQKAAVPVSQDNSTLERLIGMLEKVLLQGPAYVQANRQPATRSRLPRVEGLKDIPCSVCKDSSHSALTHCRENNLCFQCHSPEHSRHNCPAGKRPPSGQQQKN